MEIVTTPSTSASALRAPTALPCLPTWSGGEPLPERLRYILECLSGYDLSDVRVYPDSHWPARLGARAFAHGSDIHLSPGAEDALEHEAWHVVQQKQGRVRTTRTARFDEHLLGSVELNDDAALEHEADTMGLVARSLVQRGEAVPVTARLRVAALRQPVLQRQVTVLGVGYDDATKFQDEIKNRLFLTGFNVVGLADIATDLLNEKLVFPNWSEVKREILIREVGYQVVDKMRELAVEHGKRAVKAEDRYKVEINQLKLKRRGKAITKEDGEAVARRVYTEEGAILWSNASYLTYKCRNRQMFKWPQGTLNDEPLLMNCWEAVLYALVKTGLVHKSYITWCNKQAASKSVDMPDMGVPNNLADSILRNMDYFFWAPDVACHMRRMDKRIPHPTNDNDKLIKISKDRVIPKGRILMFGLNEHVALSTGTLRNGKHGILELDGGTLTIQESTLEGLKGTYLSSLVVAPFPICPAGTVRVVQEDNDKTQQRQKLKFAIGALNNAKKANVETLTQKKIDELQKTRDYPGNLQFENDVNAYIASQTKKYQEESRQECERLDSEANAKFEREFAKWNEERTPPQLDVINLEYQASDPYDGAVEFP
ncbi:DUF4157 domain-containing protein [Pyxidicoccus sp. 3LG]